MDSAGVRGWSHRFCSRPKTAAARLAGSERHRAAICPSAEDAGWAESLTWGVVTRAIIGVIRALSRQGARAAQQRWS